MRRKKGACLVEGERSLREALKSGFLEYLVIPDEKKPAAALETAAGNFPGVPLYSLENRHFQEITDVRTGTGLIGVARIPSAGDFQGLQGGHGRSVLIFLDGLQEPGNVGGIIRTGWALGIQGIMLGPGTADPFSAKGVRASAGGVFHIPIFHGVSREDLETLRESGYSFYLAESKGADPGTIPFPSRCVLILGNEGRGASAEVRGLGMSVGIPMAEGVDSLNVVAAGSMILWAMLRRGGGKPGEGKADEGTRLR